MASLLLNLPEMDPSSHDASPAAGPGIQTLSPVLSLDALSLKQRIALCRRAAAAGVARLGMLAKRVDPGDAPLLRLFEGLSRDEERHLAGMERFEASDPGEIGREDLDRMVRAFIPSLSRTHGGSFVDREAGTYLVECVLEESARLYRTLSELAPDEESRRFFLLSKEAEETQIRFLRQILL